MAEKITISNQSLDMVIFFFCQFYDAIQEFSRKKKTNKSRIIKNKYYLCKNNKDILFNTMKWQVCI